MIDLNRWTPPNRTEVVCQIDFEGSVYRLVSLKVGFFGNLLRRAPFLYDFFSEYALDEGTRTGDHVRFRPAKDNTFIKPFYRDWDGIIYRPRLQFMVCKLVHYMKERWVSPSCMRPTLGPIAYEDGVYRVREASGKYKLQVDRRRTDIMGRITWEEGVHPSRGWQTTMEMLYLALQNCREGSKEEASESSPV